MQNRKNTSSDNYNSYDSLRLLCLGILPAFAHKVQDLFNLRRGHPAMGKANGTNNPMGTVGKIIINLLVQGLLKLFRNQKTFHNSQLPKTCTILFLCHGLTLCKLHTVTLLIFKVVL